MGTGMPPPDSPGEMKAYSPAGRTWLQPCWSGGWPKTHRFPGSQDRGLAAQGAQRPQPGPRLRTVLRVIASPSSMGLPWGCMGAQCPPCLILNPFLPSMHGPRNALTRPPAQSSPSLSRLPGAPSPPPSSRSRVYSAEGMGSPNQGRDAGGLYHSDKEGTEKRTQYG